MIPVVLFFARDYQAKLFPLLKSTQYNSVYVVLNRTEKKIVLAKGGIDVICMEDEFDSLEEVKDLDSYLEYSYGCDRNYVGLNLDDRERLLKKSIAFWERILDRYAPKFIINETVAFEIAEVLAIEAEKRGIKYLSWMSFSKKNTFYWQVSPFHNSLGAVINNILPTEKHIAEAKVFVEGVRAGFEKPFYAKNSTPRYSLIRFLRNVWSILLEMKLALKMPKLKRRAVYGTSFTTNVWNIKLFLLSIFCRAKRYDDLNNFKDKELLFYPLHFEPEAVLFYMTYFFDNQVTVIENVAKCIGQNQILVIKEHPQQPGVLLEGRFRKIKERYPNVIFISGEEPVTEVLKLCSIVITLGSTAGFEALALGKKVINLGRVFYDSFESVNNCRSFEDVYSLIRGNVAFNSPGNFEMFVARMLGYLKAGNPFPHNELCYENNIDAIKKAIEDELNS